jgi:ABC-type oligopeptide transport system substrate-binding subunit
VQLVRDLFFQFLEELDRQLVIGHIQLTAASSEVTYVNRYRSGELDMTYNQLPIELFQKLKKEIPKSRPSFSAVRTRTSVNGAFWLLIS